MTVYKKHAENEYWYPRIQSVINDCIFIIKTQFDNSKYDKFITQYRYHGQRHTGYILRTVVLEYLQTGICTSEIRQNFAGGKPFIRVPIIKLETMDNEDIDVTFPIVKHLNFREIYDRQIEFEKNFFNPSGLTLEQQVRWIKEFCLSAHDELSEVMKEVPWKEFHKYDKLYNMDKAKEEAIDVLKYSLNICIALGMTADDVINMFNKKSDLVEQRLNHAKEK